jgi:hypothetical protein
MEVETVAVDVLAQSDLRTLAPDVALLDATYGMLFRPWRQMPAWLMKVLPNYWEQSSNICKRRTVFSLDRSLVTKSG